MRILWIDDEIEYLKPHIYMLKEKGYKVDTTTNGPDGLKLVREKSYDLVLVDEMMPGIDGIETLTRIKNESEDTLVTIVTKLDDEKLVDEAFGKLADDFIIKPFTPTQLLASIKRLLEKKKLVEEEMMKEFAKEINCLALPQNFEQWIQYYKVLTKWKLRFRKFKSTSFQKIEELYREESMIAFAKYLEEEYTYLIKRNEITTSKNILKNYVFPFLKEGKKIFFILFDSMRLDQYLTLLPYFKKYFNTQTKFYMSILPSATPYARNSIFSGLMPIEILKLYPHYWVWNEEEGQNRYEEELLREYVAREAIDTEINFKKTTHTAFKEKMFDEFLLQSSQFSILIINFLDSLIHSLRKENILQEVISNEYNLLEFTNTWFLNSPFPSFMERLADAGYVVILTTDHGFVQVKKPAIIQGGKVISKNLRYKYGSALQCPRKTCILLNYPEKFWLSVPQKGMRFAIAKESYYFIYPTKSKEYEAKYKFTYQHGGISPEEMILPVGILTPMSFSS